MSHDPAAYAALAGASTSPPVVVTAQSDVLAQMQAHIQMLQQQLAAQQAAAAGAPRAPGAASTGLPKPRPLSVFSGATGFAADNWLGEAQTLLEYYGAAFPDDTARIRYAVTSFDGVARNWWESLPNRASINTWAAFVDTVRQRFRPIMSGMLARQRLARLRMGDRHTVAGYVAIFQSTLLHITDMGETDKIHNFISGLPKRLQEKVWQRSPLVSSLAQAIEYAVAAEAWGNYSFGAAAPNGGYSGGGRSGMGSAPMDINNLNVGDDYFGEEAPASGPVSAAGRASTASSSSTPATAPASLDPNTLAALIGSVVEQKLNVMSGGSSSSSTYRASGKVSGLKSGEVAKLMKEGKCFRCKKTGHMKNDLECPMHPAKQSKNA